MRKLLGILFFTTLALMIIMNSCKESGKIYSINTDKCTRCRKCVQVCGSHAISWDTISNSDYLYKVSIDPTKCTGCGECVLVCSSNAITDGSITSTSSSSSSGTSGSTTSGSTTGSSSVYTVSSYMKALTGAQKE